MSACYSEFGLRYLPEVTRYIGARYDGIDKSGYINGSEVVIGDMVAGGGAVTVAADTIQGGIPLVEGHVGGAKLLAECGGKASKGSVPAHPCNRVHHINIFIVA